MGDNLLQVTPLMKVPLVRGRASSLPSPTTLDCLTEGTAAALQAEKQGTPQPPPLTDLPMLPDDTDPRGESGRGQSRPLPTLQRRNSDGGAGLAGIVQDDGPSPGSRPPLRSTTGSGGVRAMTFLDPHALIQMRCAVCEDCDRLSRSSVRCPELGGFCR